MSITVLLVDDHPVVRSGLRTVLDNTVLDNTVLDNTVLDGAGLDGAGLDDGQTLRVVGEAATGEEAIALAAHLEPDVVLCDLRLGAGIDGIRTTAALRALEHPPAVLILTTFDRDAEILGAIEAGAAGYLLKDVAPEAIADGIRRAAAGDVVLGPELATRVLRGMRNPLPRLTNREVEVLRQLATGSSNKEIARALFVTEATVKSHIAHILTKLGVDSRSRAVHVAQETGLI